jgi:hypothetical protein
VETPLPFVPKVEIFRPSTALHLDMQWLALTTMRIYTNLFVLLDDVLVILPFVSVGTPPAVPVIMF